jgi:hypothetical protein
VASPKSFSDLMSRNKHQSTLTNYQQKTGEFREIQKLLFQILDDNIAQNIIVSNYKNAILYLETPNAGIATAFKMVQSQMLTLMRQQVSAATASIQIKVSPKSTLVNAPSGSAKSSNSYALNDANQSTSGVNPVAASHATLPTDVANSIESIAENSNGQLKAALLKLAQHRKK